MFIYRIARSNRIIFGRASNDPTTTFHTFSLQPILKIVDTILDDIENLNFTVKYRLPNMSTMYYISSYSVPDNITSYKRKEILENLIDRLVIDEPLITNRMAIILGITNAILQSYSKPFQPVNIGIDNCLDQEYMLFWKTARTAYETAITNSMFRSRY